MSSLLEELRQRSAAGEYAAALNLAQELLREPGGFTARERFDVARMGAGAAVCLSDFFQARHLAEQERQFAVATDDLDLIAIGSFHRGTADMYIGNAGEALEAFTAFAAIDKPTRPALDPFRASCWFNVGTVHMQRREYQQAAAALTEANTLYTLDGNRLGAAECYLQGAWALMLAEDFELAAMHLEEATRVLAEHPDEGLQLSCICHRAFWHYRQGEFERAVALCLEVFQPGRTAATHHHKSESAWIIAECALALGKVDEASALAAAASDHALKAGESWLMNRANDLRQRIRAAGEQTA